MLTLWRQTPISNACVGGALTFRTEDYAKTDILDKGTFQDKRIQTIRQFTWLQVEGYIILNNLHEN